MKTTETFNQAQLKNNVSDIRPGDTVRVYQKIKEIVKKGKKTEEKERSQVFEGVVLTRKHGKGISATITVRKVISGIGVEKIIPIHSPLIEKIEIVKRGKTRRAKLYYLRKAKGKKAKLKRKEFTNLIMEEKEEEEKEEEEKEEEKKEEEEKETEDLEKISPSDESSDKTLNHNKTSVADKTSNE